MSLANWLARSMATPAEVRAEIWRLGVRHHGEPLEGAIQELGEGPSRSRSVLLRACIAQLRDA